MKSALQGFKFTKPTDGVLGQKSSPIKDNFDEDNFKRRHEDGELDVITGLPKTSSRHTIDVIPEVADYIEKGCHPWYLKVTITYLTEYPVHIYAAQKAGNRPLFKSKASMPTDSALEEMLATDFAETELLTPLEILDMEQEKEIHQKLYIPSDHNKIWPKPGWLNACQFLRRIIYQHACTCTCTLL